MTHPKSLGWLTMMRPLDWLLLAVPVALAIRYVPGWRNDTVLFFIAGIAVIPLAGWMGRATEHLGAREGPGIGGLLNATFGNAAELIIALMALSQGFVGVVKASITTSIIGGRSGARRSLARVEGAHRPRRGDRTGRGDQRVFASYVLGQP